MMAQHLKKFGCCKFVALSVFAKWLFSWFLLPWEVSKNSLPLPLIFNWNHYGTNIGFAMEVDLQERSSVALADRWCCLFHGSLSLQFTGTRPWNFARNLISFLEWAEQITHKFIYRLHLFSTSWHVFFSPEAHVASLYSHVCFKHFINYYRYLCFLKKRAFHSEISVRL